MKIITLLFIILFPFYALAEVCNLTSQVCTDSSTRTISGEQITRCWNYQSKYSCSSDDFVDYCSAVATAPGCYQTASICLRNASDGSCDSYENTYVCSDKLSDAGAAIYLDSEYTVTKDELDQSACAVPQSNPNCEIVAQNCIEPAETRNINGEDIYKSCWKYEYKYACMSETQYNNCEDLDKYCLYKDKKCLGTNEAGTCVNFERSYNCTIDTGKTTPSTMSCQGQIYCIDGNCQDQVYQPDTAFAEGLTYMNVLEQTSKEFDANINQVFTGEQNTCSKAITGFNNCCTNDGWGQNLSLANCSANEQALGTKVDNGQCHYVGTFCDSKALGACVKKKQSYCCFGSKLARIIQEQGRASIGMGWGDAEAPNCSGVTIEQLQSFDYKNMDFSEFYGDVEGATNLPDTADIVDDMSTRIGDYYAR